MRFFDSLWARFDLHFDGVLKSLKKHSQLVDQEASAHNIVSIQEWRLWYLDDVQKRDADRVNDQFEKVLNWLNFQGDRQEDLVDGFLDKCHPAPEEWFLYHPKVKSWRGNIAGSPSVLWVNGIPGSGKFSPLPACL